MEEERPEQSQRERRKLAKHIQDTDTLKKHYKIYKKRKHEHRFISINPHHLEEPIEEYPDSNYVTPRRNNYNKSLYSHSQDPTPQKINHINPLYPLKNQNISEYLICYQYSQNQKILQKQIRDPSIYDYLPGESLEIITHPASQQICLTVSSKSQVCLDRSQPFDRQHIALMKEMKQLMI